MAAQRFIMKKVGEKYVPVPQEDPGTTALWTASGTLVIGYGLLKRGVSGWAATLLGAGLIYRGVTGRNPISEMCGGSTRANGNAQGPSYQNDHGGRAPQQPSDDVDEAAMESFPASDPPARR